MPPAEWSLGLTETERHRRIMAEFCDHCGALPGDACVRSQWTATMVHGDRLDAAVGVDDWVIGLLYVDDDSGTFRASLDSPSRGIQVEIKGKGYRALLKQAQHVAGLHVGLLETVGPLL